MDGIERYEFTIVLAGYGRDKETAWIDACENFNCDWGTAPTECTITSEEGV
jgi:hypothetical protein